MPSRDATPSRTELSLAEHLILGLVAEKPTYGFALTRLLEPSGPLGRIYRIPRPVVYRTLDRLTDAGLVQTRRVEQGQRGPQRTLLGATPAGRRTLGEWLNRPVNHVRDFRTELLAKLALLERSGQDPAPLLAAQRDTITPIAAALAKQHRTAHGFDKTLAAWRYHTAQATLRFLDDLDHPAPAQ